jgi:hypothetical protein
MPIEQEQLGPLERNIRDLLEEARLMLQNNSIDAPAGTNLIDRLRKCARMAATNRYPFSEQCLKGAAEQIGKRFKLHDRSPPTGHKSVADFRPSKVEAPRNTKAFETA